MVKMKFFMSELQNDGSVITLVSQELKRDKKQMKALYNAINQRVILEIDFPDPPSPAKMTLEQVCKELGKDIEIIE